MGWIVAEAFLTAGITFFFVRFLIFVFAVYNRVWGIVFLIFSSLAIFLFSYSNTLDGNELSYYLQNHIMFLTIPLIFSALLTYGFSYFLFRSRSINYVWSGDTLTLFHADSQIDLTPQDIISVSSSYIPIRYRGGHMRLYKLKTTKGDFAFDENLEKNCIAARATVSFWNLREGYKVSRKYALLPYSKAKASAYFSKNFPK